MYSLIAIFIGGGLGSLARFGISKTIHSGFENINPYATLVANILSSFVLAVFIVLMSGKLQQYPVLKPLILIGFCGGFSTFSTFSFELFELIKNGHIFFSFIYIITSIISCLAIIYLIIKFL